MFKSLASVCEFGHMQDGVTGVEKAHEIHGKRHPQGRREQELMFCCVCSPVCMLLFKHFPKRAFKCSAGKPHNHALESNPSSPVVLPTRSHECQVVQSPSKDTCAH